MVDLIMNLKNTLKNPKFESLVKDLRWYFVFSLIFKTDITVMKKHFFQTKKIEKIEVLKRKRRRISSLQDLGSVKAVDKVKIQFK